MAVSNLCSRNCGSGRAGATHGKMCRKGKTFMELKRLSGNSDSPYRILRNALLSTLAAVMLFPELANAATEPYDPLDYESLCFNGVETQEFEKLMLDHTAQHGIYRGCIQIIQHAGEDLLSPSERNQLDSLLDGLYDGPAGALVRIHDGQVKCTLIGDEKIRMQATYELKTFTTADQNKRYCLWVSDPKRPNDEFVAILKTNTRYTTAGKRFIEPALRFYNKQPALWPHRWHHKGAWQYTKCRNQDEDTRLLDNAVGSTTSASVTYKTSDTQTHSGAENYQSKIVPPIEVTHLEPSLIESLDAEHKVATELLIEYAQFTGYFEQTTQVLETDDDRLKFLILKAHQDPMKRSPLNELVSKLCDREKRRQSGFSVDKSKHPAALVSLKKKKLSGAVKYLKGKFSPESIVRQQHATSPHADSPLYQDVDGVNVYTRLPWAVAQEKREAKQRKKEASRSSNAKKRADRENELKSTYMWNEE